MAIVRRLLCLVTALLGLAAAAPAAAAPQRIENTAILNLTRDGAVRQMTSNTTRLDLGATISPSQLAFYVLPPNTDLSEIQCEPGPPQMIAGAPFTTEQYMDLKQDDDLGATDFVAVLQAPGENLDPAVRETLVITISISNGDDGFLMLTETGPDSGIFAGGFASSNTPSVDNDCALTILRGARVDIRFAGSSNSMPSSDSILIDPYGHVFDSATGLPVSGARITLIDDATGRAAHVFGDDGVSAYPSTVVSGEDVVDAAGYRYDYGPGEYRFPFVAPGNYHLVFVTADGYVAPSVVAVQALPAGSDGPYVVSDASYGRAFALTSPLPLRVDIPVDPIASNDFPTAPPGALVLQKTASVQEASPGDFIRFALSITNPRDTDSQDAAITDSLPLGLRYTAGSTRGAPEPSLSPDGRTLRFSMGAIAAGQSKDVTYVLEATPGAPAGQAINRAVAQSPGAPASAVASAGVRIKPFLLGDALTIIGRVTEGACGPPKAGRKGVEGVRLLIEDGTYVVTDRDGLYHFEGVRAGRHVVQLDVANLSEAFEPILCDDDTRSAGNAISRFVEGQGGGLHRVDFQLRPTGKADTSASLAAPDRVADDAVAAGGDTDWMIGQTPGVDWLFPGVDHNPRAPVQRVVIKHRPGQRIALTLNGAPIDALAFDGTDKADDVAISRWTSLPLRDGDNLLEARVLDPSGAVAATLKRVVHYANAPVRAVLVPEKSRLVADGRTQPLIAVRLTDREGRPVRAGTLAPFSLDQPYVAAEAADMQMRRKLAGLERADPTARVVGDDGMAFIALQPTTQGGAARFVFNLAHDGVAYKSELRPWLTAGVREWVVVGFGAGTVGYDTLLSRSERPKGDGEVVTQGQLSLYAKGMIKGEWLLTMAYDSARVADPDRALLSTIDPDRYYTVYGDGSRQAYDAASRRKLYLRLERREAFALFGDYETGLTDTRLARYSRTLNGFKAGLRGRILSLLGFAARSDQRYARDEIQGAGLSGPYRLSGRKLVPGSDKVTIEVRDRLRSERILSSKVLTRHVDYDIDSSIGVLRFREPITTRDSNLNPIFIVVDYEVEGAGDERLVTGGRVSARLAKERVEIGATYLHDESQGDAALAGVDLKARLSDRTELRAEAASGGLGGVDSDQAYLVEVDHHDARIDVLAYLRSQEAGFGLGQQNLGEAGALKYGADGVWRLGQKFTLTGSVWRQEALAGPETRTAGDIKLEYRRRSGSFFAGLQTASDEGPAGEQTQSRLLTLGATQSFLKERLQVSGQTQSAIGGDKASLDFPIRHQITAAYAVSEAVRLIASHEIADGEDFLTRTTRVGFDLTPWAGAKLATTLNQQAIGENGARSFAEFGLSQSLPIGDRWTIDATLDASERVNRVGEDDGPAPVQPTPGGFLGRSLTYGDYRSMTLGATYRAPLWSWTGRIESRQTDAGDRWGVTSNVLRALGQGKTLASGLRVYREDQADGAATSFASADVALAWRPLDSRWAVLDRVELKHERAAGGARDTNARGVVALPDADQITTRLINNLTVSYHLGDDGELRGLEASVYYGAKYVNGRFGDDDYDGYVDVLGLELRRDLGRRFDIGVSASMQNAWDTGVTAFSAGPSVGYSPSDDVWISAGYNVVGFRDRDFEAARYTREGFYVTARMKFDQRGLGAAVGGLRGMFR